MTISLFIKEVRNLIRNNIGFILKTTSVLSIVFLLAIFLLFRDLESSDNNNEMTENTATSFEIYIENEDDTVFINSYLLEILVTRPDVLEMLEHESNVQIQPIIESYASENELYYTNEDPINIERNTSSNIMEVTIDLGDSESNLAVADTIVKWISETDISFLENKEVYIMSKPDFVTDDFKVASETTDSEWSNLAKFIVITLIFSLMLSLLFVALKEFFNKFINYSFSYSVPLGVTYLNLDKEDKELIAYNTLQGNSDIIYILFQYGISQELNGKLKLLSDNYLILNSSSEMPLNTSIKNIVILVEKGRTTKKWFDTQMKTVSTLADCEVKVLEV